jgi:tRNA threonylcarbamoyladenosine biosynthesis protein TsaB
MAIFLNIDTAVESASVCLSDDDKIIKTAINHNQRDHAAWLHNAIREMLNDAGIPIGNLSAVAISNGPGSYTGLRVGLSAAKGLCYALDIPLITIGTLEIMAHAAINEPADLFCPLIDARRMEVFTAMYDSSMKEIQAPTAMLIDESSFTGFLKSSRVCFCGNGKKKLQNVINHSHAIFSDCDATAGQMPYFTHRRFIERQFADLAYAEPLYVKEFYTPKH